MRGSIGPKGSRCSSHGVIKGYIGFYTASYIRICRVPQGAKQLNNWCRDQKPSGLKYFEPEPPLFRYLDLHEKGAEKICRREGFQVPRTAYLKADGPE